VILVTTHADPADVEEGYRNGCNGYLKKPIDLDALVSSVESCLGVAS
jgi:DNA-binding NarL/FixJ family response regulator